MVTCQGCCSTSFHPWSTFFLIYINDLSDDLVSSVEPFAGGTSLFSVVHESNISANELNNDL